MIENHTFFAFASINAIGVTTSFSQLQKFEKKYFGFKYSVHACSSFIHAQYMARKMYNEINYSVGLFYNGPLEIDQPLFRSAIKAHNAQLRQVVHFIQ